MPPELRRAALIEATLPLIERHGIAVTTRQVAEAARVAEGTIFRAFESLQALIEATIASAFSRERLAALLDGVDLGDQLPTMTANTIELLTRRLQSIRSVLMATHHSVNGPDTCVRDQLVERRRELDAWLVSHFTPFSAQLAVTPEQYVAFLRQLATGAALNLGPGLETGVSVSIALHGALRKEPM